MKRSDEQLSRCLSQTNEKIGKEENSMIYSIHIKLTGDKGILTAQKRPTSVS